MMVQICMTWKLHKKNPFICLQSQYIELSTVKV